MLPEMKKGLHDLFPIIKTSLIASNTQICETREEHKVHNLLYLTPVNLLQNPQWYSPRVGSQEDLWYL